MMQFTRLQRFVALAVAVAIAAVSGRSLRLMNAEKSHAITQTDTAWVRYVMVGLGGFRGAISEVLWMRADRLQAQGRFSELAQLSRWINALDPRAADAWAFSAWNLAYNLGAMSPDVPSKLHWLHEGISLLRNQAIPANPSTPSLYRELGWLYQNKIGGSDDSAHLAFKLDLAMDGSRPVAEQYHPLNPAICAEIEERFGHLDWQIAYAHAIYWAWQGLALDPTGFDRASLRRMVQQNLVNLIYSGRFTGNATAGVWNTAPQWNLLVPTMDFFEETAEQSDGERHVYAHFLEAIIPRLESANQRDLAALAAKRLAALEVKTHSNN